MDTTLLTGAAVGVGIGPAFNGAIRVWSVVCGAGDEGSGRGDVSRGREVVRGSIT